MSDITHTVEINVPAWAWKPVSEGLRDMRVVHRDAGGTPRLVRNGDTVTFTATGPALAVLSVCASVVKVGECIADERERMEERKREGWKPVTLWDRLPKNALFTGRKRT